MASIDIPDVAEGVWHQDQGRGNFRGYVSACDVVPGKTCKITCTKMTERDVQEEGREMVNDESTSIPVE